MVMLNSGRDLELKRIAKQTNWGDKSKSLYCGSLIMINGMIEK